MADDEDKKDEGAEKAKKPKKDSSVGKLLGVIVAVLLIQAGIAFGVVKLSAPKDEPVVETNVQDSTSGGDIENANVGKEAIVPDEFTQVVNISGTNGMRFLKIGISLAYDEENEANENFLIVLLDNKVRIRSHIVEYLSSLTLEEVNDRNAQQNVRRDLLRELNRTIPSNSGEFSNVYITEFIIQ